MSIIKSISFFGLALAVLFACKSGKVVDTDNNPNTFGESITAEQAISVNDLYKQMQSAEKVNAKVTGEVKSVCKKAGCWMTFTLPNGDDMMVKFKDYGFFVPKDIDGKTVVVQGEAFHEEISVDKLRHFAEDAGKSKEEIDAITEPEQGLSFIADGVLLLN